MGIPFVVWKEEYEVGHADLDAHHRRLIEIINTLYETAAAGASEKRLDETMREMEGYARLHFQAEEEVLEGLGYPRLPQQQKAHESYLSRLDELKASFNLPTGALSQETLEFLKKWWLNHIIAMDREYSAYINLPPSAIKGA